MRYFLLKQDKRITDMPYPKDFHENIDVRDLSANRAGLVSARTLLQINPSEHTVFPDVICDPALLITREVKEVVKAYEEYMVYRQMIYLDSENELVQSYFMPMPELIDCLSDRSEYTNASRSEFSRLVLKRQPIRDHSLFKVKHRTQRLLVIRLDLAESLLTRDYKGFTLVEAATEA